MSERSIEHSIKFSVKCISSGMKNNTLKEDEKITARDIYERLWKCRDFELTHLWQRSIFLTTFLVLCFTGYGTILLKLYKNIADMQKGVSITILHVAGILVAFLGLILSVLWIMMAKGSKAWYEMYERAIYSIESDTFYAQDVVVKKMKDDRLKNEGLAPPEDMNNCLLSAKAGAFSPSKINITIGQIAMLIWILVCISHVTVVLSSDLAYPAIPYLKVIIAFTCVIVATLLVAFFLRYWCKSSYISNAKKK